MFDYVNDISVNQSKTLYFIILTKIMMNYSLLSIKGNLLKGLNSSYSLY